MTDGVERLHDLERSTLRDLYARYGAWLIARLRLRYGVEAAEDLSQDTWIKVAPYEARGAIEHPKALLLTIASNLALNRQDQARRRTKILSSGPFGVQGRSEDAAQTDALMLKQVILGLPEAERDVFVMARFGGLTYEQIGERLGIPLTTVQWRMSRALELCGKQLRL